MKYLKEPRTAGFRNAEKDKLREDSNTVENTKGIENHLKAAEYFLRASQHHHEAAKYHEEGNHEKASQSALIAIGCAFIAREYQMQDAKQHALEG